MDLRMPVLDGREAARSIRAGAEGHAPAIVALTASGFEEERADVLAAGYDDVLRKPFHEADLFALLQRHLGVRFVYGDEPEREPGAPSPGVDAAALASLPEGLLTALENALIQLDGNEVGRVIEEIRARDARLADSLAVLAEEFQYGKLLRLIPGADREGGGEGRA
jgi:DNA-binding response OmpR family regulator